MGTNGMDPKRNENFVTWLLENGCITLRDGTPVANEALPRDEADFPGNSEGCKHAATLEKNLG